MIRLSDSSSRRTVRILAGVCLLAVAYLCTYSRWWMLGFLAIAIVIAMNAERKRVIKRADAKWQVSGVAIGNVHAGQMVGVVLHPPGADINGADFDASRRIHRTTKNADGSIASVEPMYPNVVTIASREGYATERLRAFESQITEDVAAQQRALGIVANDTDPTLDGAA